MDPTNLLVFSLSKTREAGEGAAGGGTQEKEDIFHTLPSEKSSPPNSGTLFDHCTLNQEHGAHNDALGIANLGKDSDIGFTKVQLVQGG